MQSHSICGSSSLCQFLRREERTTFPAFRPISQLPFRVTGHFIQICPAFLRSGKFFSCTVRVKGGRERGRVSRVSRHGILLVPRRQRWSRFFSLSSVPLPFPDVLFAREEGGKPTCRAGVVRDFGRKKSRAKKVMEAVFQSPTTPLPSLSLLPPFCPPFFHLCIPTEFAASSPSTKLTVGHLPSVLHCSEGWTERRSGAKTRICLFCGAPISSTHSAKKWRRAAP